MMALLSKAVSPPLVVAAMILAAAFLGWASISAVRQTIDDVRSLAVAERNAFWIGEIERGNAEANRRIAEQATRAMQIQADATERLRLVEQQFAEKEAQNAALPDGDGRGLSRARVRLLAQ